MNRRRTLTAAVLAGTLAITVAACSSTTDDPAAMPMDASAMPMSGTAADVAFAQSMIPHHQQAIEMADLALNPDAQASPQVRKLATAIKGAQDPEIQQMTDWLQQWGAPTAMPGAGGDISGMDHGGHDMGGMTMSGMMTSEDMAALSQASGTEFDSMWLQMMIAHHEGAVVMAEQVKAQSDNSDVTALADQVITAQKQEIDTMKQLLAQ
jgi:uncharacterized protein (DUF305 family)